MPRRPKPDPNACPTCGDPIESYSTVTERDPTLGRFQDDDTPLRTRIIATPCGHEVLT